jgi:hypothetical protein
MTIHHTQLPPTLIDGHQRGWTLTADQFADWLERRLPKSATPEPPEGR